jgi:maltooligosyltrehalose trehalohydrolase
MTAVLLLAPGTPMLFQGQEFCASSPFLYFANHKPELAVLVKDGRRQFLRQWRDLRLPVMDSCLADPGAESTFEKSKLDHSEVEKHAEQYRLHRDLLELRRRDSTISAQDSSAVDGAVLGSDAFLIRFFGEENDDRLLLVNFGIDLVLNPLPDSLFAPPDDKQWAVMWSSEDPAYGGCGQPAIETSLGWFITGHAAALLKPSPREEMYVEAEGTPATS